MERGRLSIVAAIANNGVIGRGGDLPWRLSADLRRFQRLTMGHPLVMGRKTWHSIGRPLPGRTSIVVTRQHGWTPGIGVEGVGVANDLPAALEQAARAEGGREEIFVIGGAELYAAALPLADRCYVTRVHASVPGDVFFPEVQWSQWRLLDREEGQADDRNDYAYSFETYDLAV